MFQRIICPIDGSETSNHALKTAIQLAKDQDAALLLLHVIDLYIPIVDPFGSAIYNLPSMNGVMRKNGHHVLESAEVEAKKKELATESTMVEAFGTRVSKSILEEAQKWKADLIVMGTHGLKGFERLVMGSDAESVVRNSRLPVLLLPSASKD